MSNELRDMTKKVYFILAFVLLLSSFSGFIVTFLGLSVSMPTVIVTGSMEPEICVNSVVFLEQVPYDDLEVGNVIRYDNGMYSVLHRIISKNTSYVVVQGDANAYPDNIPITRDMITGKVVSIHNEYAPIITFIFGKIDTSEIVDSIVRVLLGIGLIVAVLSFSICIFIVVFEMVTIHWYFKKNNSVKSTSKWLEKMTSTEEMESVVLLYKEQYSSSGVFRRLWLAFWFRKYYNSWVAVGEKVIKADKKARFFRNVLNKNLWRNKNEE